MIRTRNLGGILNCPSYKLWSPPKATLTNIQQTRMSTHLYIIRHAETALNRQGILQGSSIDSDINEFGRRQSQAFFDHYQHIDFELVVTSALKRTHQTVEPFLSKGINWHVTPNINEISWGDHEGKPTDGRWKLVWEEVRDHWNAGNLEARMPGGESAAELNARLSNFLEWLKLREERHILICTHGRSLRGLISLMKGVTLAEMEGNPHTNTGCYVAQFREATFHFLAENSTDHLLRLVE